MMEEKAVIQKAKKRNPEAIAQLYQTHNSAVYRFIYYKVGNKEDAEDLAQEVFIAAFDGLKGFRGDASFRNWCYEIAKHKIADLWRGKYKMPIVDIEAILGLYTTQVHTEDRVEKEQEAVAHITQVSSLLDQLQENYRQVLEYRFLKNYSIKETAEAMNISVSNAKVLQHRALKKAATLGFPLSEHNSPA